MAYLDLNIVGGFGSVMRIIDHEPLGYATSMGVDADSAVGHADVNVTLDFPLARDLKLDQVGIEIEASVSDVGIPEVAFDLALSKGRLNITLDRGGMDVSGSAHLGEIPVSLAWRENFSGGAFRSRYILDPVVSNEQRLSIGLGVVPFTPPYIDGPVSAHVVYTVGRDLTASMKAHMNLTEPVIGIPELSWRKASGISAQADVVASFVDGKLEEVSSFEVRSGDDLLVAGSATFGKDTKLKSLQIEPSEIGKTRLTGDMFVNDVGDYTVEVSGSALNGTSLLGEVQFGEGVVQSDSEEKLISSSVKLYARFDHVWLTPEAKFSEVSLDFRSDPDGVQFVDFMSKVDAEVPFDFKLTNGPDGRTFYGSSANGGSVMRAVGVFDDIVGGDLKVTGTLDSNGVMSGLAEISEFKLVDAPVVARLLSVAALTGILDELRGEGISFKTLRVPFSYANTLLEIYDGEMFGNSLGLTGQGDYNVVNTAMNFEGTIIPAYAINSAFNLIPLIGTLLTAGDEGGGVFAATYSYRGDVATARPIVNPLAALAPGFLRYIFDIFKARPEESSLTPAGVRETSLSKFKEESTQR